MQNYPGETRRKRKRATKEIPSIWLGLMYKIPVVGKFPKIWNVYSKLWKSKQNAIVPNRQSIKQCVVYIL